MTESDLHVNHSVAKKYDLRLEIYMGNLLNLHILGLHYRDLDYTDGVPKAII